MLVSIGVEVSIILLIVLYFMPVLSALIVADILIAWWTGVWL